MLCLAVYPLSINPKNRAFLQKNSVFRVNHSILTAEISKATFGVTPKEHGEIKGLEKQNLRDHITNFEKELGKPVVSTDNFLGLNGNKKRELPQENKG